MNYRFIMYYYLKNYFWVDVEGFLMPPHIFITLDIPITESYFMRSSVMEIMCLSLEGKIERLVVRCGMMHCRQYSLQRHNVISRCCNIKGTPCI